jgi:hypothetical protein
MASTVKSNEHTLSKKSIRFAHSLSNGKNPPKKIRSAFNVTNENMNLLLVKILVIHLKLNHDKYNTETNFQRRLACNQRFILILNLMTKSSVLHPSKISYFMLFLGILTCKYSHSQIITNSKPSTVSPSGNLNKSRLDTTTFMFFSTGFGKSNRNLTSNEDFLNTPLGERAKEFAINRWNFNLGISFPVYRFIRFEGGISMLQNGEQYAFQSEVGDSSFQYQNRSRYIGMPLQLQLSYGKNWAVYGGGGLIPQIFSSYRQEQQWTNEDGTKFSKRIDETDKYDYFALSWVTSAGIRYNGGGKFGLRFNLTYRQQITNSYTKYQDYIHKAHSFGGDLGFTLRL